MLDVVCIYDALSSAQLHTVHRKTRRVSLVLRLLPPLPLESHCLGTKTRHTKRNQKSKSKRIQRRRFLRASLSLHQAVAMEEGSVDMDLSIAIACPDIAAFNSLIECREVDV